MSILCRNCGKMKFSSDKEFIKKELKTSHDMVMTVPSYFCKESCLEKFLLKSGQVVAIEGKLHLCITCDKEFFNDNPKQISKHGYSPVCDSCYSKRISTTI